MANPADIRNIFTQLKTIPPTLSPLQTLRTQIQIFFSHGKTPASIIFSIMTTTVQSGTTQIPLTPMLSILKSPPLYTNTIPWNSCKAAATLLLMFACSPTPNDLFLSYKLNSQTLRGTPDLHEIRTNTSGSLEKEYKKAKERAIKGGKFTVISVQLSDVWIQELAKQGRSGGYTSFAHSFVMGVGEEGVVVWQAWGEFGYGIDEYLERGGARIRSWEEADNFVSSFEKFLPGKGAWNFKRNKAYQQCFAVDINKICGPHGPGRPIVPKFEAWVRLHVWEDVKQENLRKFEWIDT